jgi:hypothetical protein
MSLGSVVRLLLYEAVISVKFRSLKVGSCLTTRKCRKSTVDSTELSKFDSRISAHHFATDEKQLCDGF